MKTSIYSYPVKKADGVSIGDPRPDDENGLPGDRRGYVATPLGIVGIVEVWVGGPDQLVLLVEFIHEGREYTRRDAGRRKPLTQRGIARVAHNFARAVVAGAL